MLHPVAQYNKRAILDGPQFSGYTTASNLRYFAHIHLVDLITSLSRGFIIIVLATTSI